MKPRKSILSPDFVYRDSAHTNLAQTFARERKRLAALKAKPSNIEPLALKRKTQ